MNRSLRTAHRNGFLALGVLLPVGVAATLFARPAELPRTNTSPASSGDEGTPHERGTTLRSRASEGSLSIEGTIVRTELQPPPDSPSPSTLELWLSDRSHLPLGPDTLVYRVPAGTDPAEGLPARATLLGTFVGETRERYEWPGDTDAAASGVMLYSLAHDEVLALLESANGGR